MWCSWYIKRRLRFSECESAVMRPSIIRGGRSDSDALETGADSGVRALGIGGGVGVLVLWGGKSSDDEYGGMVGIAAVVVVIGRSQSSRWWWYIGWGCGGSRILGQRRYCCTRSEVTW